MTPKRQCLPDIDRLIYIWTHRHHSRTCTSSNQTKIPALRRGRGSYLKSVCAGKGKIKKMFGLIQCPWEHQPYSRKGQCSEITDQHKTNFMFGLFVCMCVHNLFSFEIFAFGFVCFYILYLCLVLIYFYYFFIQYILIFISPSLTLARSFPPNYPPNFMFFLFLCLSKTKT